MKKKVLSVVLSIVLLMSFMVGCTSKADTKTETSVIKEEEKTEETTVAVKDTTEEATTEVVAEPEIDWPTKTVEVVIHAGAGGDTDFNTRTMAKYFEEITGKSMVVTNMTGGGGSIATSFVKDAEPDGYTMLCTHTGPMIVNEISGLIDYSIDSFEIANLFAVNKATVLVTRAGSGIKSVEDLIAKAKAEPNSIVYGSELGGYSHLQGLMLQDFTGIELKIVDTGSTSDKIVALLGERIDLASIAYGSVQDYEETGELVMLAQFNNERNKYIDQIPTFAESGIDFAMEMPYISAFPKGTDERIVKKFDSIILQITQNPQYQEDLKLGFKQPVDYYSNDVALEYLQQMREEFMKYKELLR